MDRELEKSYDEIKNKLYKLTDKKYHVLKTVENKPFKIIQANVAFNPNHVELSKFDAKTGSSDLQVNGTLDNFYGFLFKNQILKGNFNMNATKLVVSDFMAPTTKVEEGKKTTEAVKIPSFLDCTITAKAGTVVYDNLNLKNVSGTLLIKDEAVNLNNLKMDIMLMLL